MECKEEIVDLRKFDPESMKESQRISQLVFKLNQTMPMTEDYFRILKAKGVSQILFYGTLLFFIHYYNLDHGISIPSKRSIFT